MNLMRCSEYHWVVSASLLAFVWWDSNRDTVLLWCSLLHISHLVFALRNSQASYLWATWHADDLLQNYKSWPAQRSSLRDVTSLVKVSLTFFEQKYCVRLMVCIPVLLLRTWNSSLPMHAWFVFKCLQMNILWGSCGQLLQDGLW